MIDVLKKVNKVLRVIFIGFIAVFGLLKVFENKSDRTEKRKLDEADYVTSEFDEIW